MNGVILAAGRGSRLGEATALTPKCLLPFNGRTLLERQIARLNEAGIERPTVITGWMAHEIERVAPDCIHNPRWAETSMVGTLLYADSLLSDDVTIVSYSDIIYGGAITRALAECADDFALAYDPAWLRLWQSRFAEPLADAETFALDNKGYVTEIGRRPRDVADVKGQYMGLIRFTPHSWAEVRRVLATRFEAGTPQPDMTMLIRTAIEAGVVRARGIENTEPWCEIDNPEDLPVCERVARELDAGRRRD